MTAPEVPHADLIARPWQAGDPCASCGSTLTGWNAVDGAQCFGCGRGDDDE